MKKTLRFSLLSFMLMFVGNVVAQGVTFDFDNDYAKLFPTLAGTSANDSHDGDFTEATTSILVEGFTVTVSAKDEGVSNANRIWSGAPRLRMYSGTFTVTGKGIKKIEFESNDKFNVTAGSGTLEGKVWTGEADEVVFTIGGNTQLKKIVINGDGGGETPNPQPGEVQTVTIAAFNAAAESNDVWYQLTGTIKNLKDGDQYGNFDLEDETGSVYVYGVLSEKGGAKKKFQELVAEKGIKEGDKLTIIGNRGSYNDKIEVLNAYFVSVVSGGDTPIEPQEPDHTNVTIADLSNATAKIANVNLTLNNAQVLYANGARVFVREGDKAILFYSLGIDDLKTNAILNGSIKGKLDIYNNLNEFCKTEYTKTDALTITQSETTAEPLAIDMADAKNHVSDLVKFTGVSFTDINGKNAVANLDGKTLPVYDQFGLFTDNMEGVFDLTGVITVYKENVQIYPIAISTASGVKALKLDQNTNAPAYNLSGQQVSGSYRGLVIKNGRKFMVK